MLKTYILEIDKDLSKDDFKRLLGFISDEKRERVLRFHRYEDAQRSVLADVLARYAICKRLESKNKDLVFGANEFGKPVLTIPGGIHFNVSHSGNWVVCAIEDDPVGIDVEVIRSIDLNIAERFFSKNEYKVLLSQPEEMRLKYFYLIWTLKESYIKAEGKGLNIPLKSFDLSNIVNGSTATIDHHGKIIYNFSILYPNDITVCTVCSLNKILSKQRYYKTSCFVDGDLHFLL